MSRRWIAAICLSIILAPASGMFFYFWQLGGFEPPDVTPMTFESSAWKRADPIEKYRTIRSQMVDDLIQRRLLDGLTRDEVEELLGPPITELRKAGVDSSRFHIAYYIGLERHGSFSLDDELLAIRFDDDGRVSEYRSVVN